MYVVNIHAHIPDHTYTYALLAGNAYVYVFERIFGLNTCTCAFLKAVHICMYLPVSRVHIHAHMRFCAVAAQLHSRRIAVASPSLHRRRIAVASPSLSVAARSFAKRRRRAYFIKISSIQLPHICQCCTDPLHTEVEPQPWILGGATMRTLVRSMAETL